MSPMLQLRAVPTEPMLSLGQKVHMVITPNPALVSMLRVHKNR
jgi:hypothetical protein